MRLVNRLLCALLALAVAGAGLLTAAEVVVARTNWPTDPPLVVPYDHWLTALQTHSWSAGIVLGAAIASVVLGLLLVAASISGRERRIALAATGPDTDASTSRRSVARALRHDAATVDGIGSAGARWRRRSAVVRAQVRLGDPAAIEAAVTDAATHRLTSLELAETPALSVRVSDERRFR